MDVDIRNMLSTLDTMQHKVNQYREAKRAKMPASSFAEPQPVSAALAAFVGAKEVSRLEATKKIREYVSEKGLLHGDEVFADEALRPVIGCEMSLFELQVVLDDHFFRKTT